MIGEGDCLLHGRDGGHGRQSGPVQHDHRDVEGARRGDFGVGRLPAAVAGHDELDGMLRKQRMLARFGERPALSDVDRVRECRPSFRRVNAANPILMLRRPLEWCQLLAAERKKNSPRRFSERMHRSFHIIHFDPVIPAHALPSGATQREQRDTCLLRGACGIHRYLRRVRMRGVNKQIDAIGVEIIGKSGSSAKATDAHRYALGRRLLGPSSERQHHRETRTRGERARQRPCFRCASKNKDALHGNR